MRSPKSVWIALVTLIFGVQCDRSTPDDAWIEQARSLTGEFQATLKGKLVTAMKEGGPPRAIEICNVEAPKIESQITGGKAADWTASRTALRIRNPKNAPTDWQKEGLIEIERRISAGEPPDRVDWRGHRGDHFVYMRPIMMDRLCMTCHGPLGSIPPTVKTELDRLYPQDEATGFSMGDLRGAFVVTGPRTRR